jgi:hypothetical protein
VSHRSDRFRFLCLSGSNFMGLSRDYNWSLAIGSNNLNLIVFLTRGFDSSGSLLFHYLNSLNGSSDRFGLSFSLRKLFL